MPARGLVAHRRRRGPALQLSSRIGRVIVLASVAGCAIDESGLGQDAGVDVEVDVGPKDVTVIDVFTSDVQVEDVALDVAPDVTPTTCTMSKPFGSFINLGAGVDTGAFESSPSLTSDELTIFFARDVGGGRLGLFYATRASTSQPFGSAQAVTTISTNLTWDTAPFVVDGLSTLYFTSTRNGATHYDLYQALGNGTPDGWGTIALLAALSANDPAADTQPWIANGTNEVWFASDRLGTLDLYTAQSTTSTPVVSTILSSPAEDNHPVLSHDALTIFFGRTDTQSHVHVWTSTRASTVAPFGLPTLVADFDQGSSSNTPGWLSVDGCRMYFTSDRGGGKGSSDLWVASRPQ